MAEKINKYGPQSPQTLQSLKTPVKQIVIGPSHLGLLLEDGRALRVAFTVITERLDLSKAEPSKGYVHAKNQQIQFNSRFNSLFRFHFVVCGCRNGSGGGGNASTSNASSGAKQTSSTSRQLARSRARIMRASNSVRSNGGSGGGSGGGGGGSGGGGSSGQSGSTNSRGTGVIIGSSSSGRPLVTVPAPFVPEELVSQAQVVFAGQKS